MARAKVIAQVVAGSQPSLSVASRADGGGYTVTAGARALTITAEAGATLLTTVTDQDNGSITVTDSTSTTPSWTAPGGGTTGADYCVQVTATKGGYTEQVSFSELVDGSGGGGGSGGTLAALLDIDWAALHTASGAYDFLVDGPAGDGTHSYGGYTFVLVGSSQVTQLEVTANGLEMAQNTGGAFQLGVNLRDLGTAIDPAGPCHVLTRVASATSGAAGDGVQVGAQRDPTLGNWTKGDAVVRYRRADATPDLYLIVYNGSTYDATPSGTLTASADVRMQVGLTALYSSVGRGDTGTATDPADWDALGEFADVSYSDAIGSFAGVYPADADLWAFVGCGNSGSGTFKTLTAYGLTA